MQVKWSQGQCRVIQSLLALWLGAVCCTSAFGSAALLLEEPYGFFGGINPTGHAAMYLNNVCADSPTVLRRCEPGETGVVISRYQGIGDHDWVAMPLLPYLYSVERAEDVPTKADAELADLLRKKYGEEHLNGLSIRTDGTTGKDGWNQLLGVAYIRKIYAFEFATEQEQDDRLIEAYNSGPNLSHFNLFTNNCADFSKQVINFYYPGAVRRSFTADLAITTPKQLAKSLVHYSRRHERLTFSEYVIAQVPGSIPRSHRPRGIVESLVKTKKYAIPIAVFHPYFLVGMAATYLTSGRFNPATNAPVVAVDDLTATMVTGKVLTAQVPKWILTPGQSSAQVESIPPPPQQGSVGSGIARGYPTGYKTADYMMSQKTAY